MKSLVGHQPRYAVQTRREWIESWSQEPNFLDSPICPVCKTLLNDSQSRTFPLYAGEYACPNAICPLAGKAMRIEEKA